MGIYQSSRTHRPRHEPCRPSPKATWSPSRKSAECTIATNAAQPDVRGRPDALLTTCRPQQQWRPHVRAAVEFRNRAPHVYGSSVARDALTAVTILAKDSPWQAVGITPISPPHVKYADLLRPVVPWRQRATAECEPGPVLLSAVFVSGSGATSLTRYPTHIEAGSDWEEGQGASARGLETQSRPRTGLFTKLSTAEAVT